MLLGDSLLPRHMLQVCVHECELVTVICLDNAVVTVEDLAISMFINIFSYFLVTEVDTHVANLMLKCVHLLLWGFTKNIGVVYFNFILVECIEASLTTFFVATELLAAAQVHKDHGDVDACKQEECDQKEDFVKHPGVLERVMKKGVVLFFNFFIPVNPRGTQSTAADKHFLLIPHYTQDKKTSLHLLVPAESSNP